MRMIMIQIGEMIERSNDERIEKNSKELKRIERE
jgi:hypothetical protein